MQADKTEANSARKRAFVRVAGIGTKLAWIALDSKVCVNRIKADTVLDYSGIKVWLYTSILLSA